MPDPTADFPALASPAHLLVRPRLFIDVQHGLCNRLRAFVSAAAIAENTGHVPVLIWCPDHHCQARVRDLLEFNGPLIEDPDDAAQARAFAAQTYNYMEVEPGAVYDAPVQPGEGDVYVRSAYTLSGPLADFEREQALLRALRPSRAVRDLVAQVPHPSDLAAHVRATGHTDDALASYDAEGNWPAERHAEITAWRAKSQPERFMSRIDGLMAEGQVRTLFVAADRAETYALFAARYGDRLRWLDRDLFDRSARQQQYALADLLLLTAADRFLGSTWSSFSDMAQRLARFGRPVEQSGRDF